MSIEGHGIDTNPRADVFPTVSDGNITLTTLLAALVMVEFACITLYFAVTENKKDVFQISTLEVTTIAKTMTSIVAFTDLSLAHLALRHCG